VHARKVADVAAWLDASLADAGKPYPSVSAVAVRVLSRTCRRTYSGECCCA
jgi:hypothetical protein